jgi:DMSO/TMAO reductase YedYZ molybdopterin-dependent catalytic subunit
MAREISRRQILAGALITGGVAAIGGGAASVLTGRGLGYFLPPSIGSLGGVAELMSYAGGRLILTHRSLVPEYPASAITMLDHWQKNAPADPELLPHLATEFESWRLPVTGGVLHPGSFSIAELGKLPTKTQIVARHCINGYTSISPYTGVPLRELLAAVGLAPDVRYIGFESYYDGGWDSIDLFDAFHPQTVLAYEEFPGTRVSWTRGAPLRLCAPLHYGYKWIKGIRRIIALENLDTFGDGTGMGSSYASKGRTWFAGAA